MKIERHFSQVGRYRFDFQECSTKNGFAQVDTEQDAAYYGTWANPHDMVIVNYAEGDITICRAESEAEFAGEIRRIKSWNEDMGHRFLGIDPGFNVPLRDRFVDMGLGDLLH